MIVYHAGNMTIEKPALIIQNRFLDFGFGFYTTLNLEQAIAFSRKVTRKRGCGHATVNRYEVDDKAMLAQCSLLKFSRPDKAWLDFVSANRQNAYRGKRYDLIYGPVADDDVYTTVAAYINGTFNAETALMTLKVKRLFDQLVFVSVKSLSFLQPIGVNCYD